MLLSCVPFSLNPHSLHVHDKIHTPRMTGSASRSAHPYLSSLSFTHFQICALSPAVWNDLWGPTEKPHVSILSCFSPRCLTASINVCQAVMCLWHWRRKWQPPPIFLSWKSHGQRRLAGYGPWGRERVRHDLATKRQQCACLSCLARA